MTADDNVRLQQFEASGRGNVVRARVVADDVG